MFEEPEFTFAEWEIKEFINSFKESRPNFYLKAVCAGTGINTFFPGRGQSSLVKKAVQVCKGCPVQFECHEYAINNAIEHGVWGGSTPDQRTQWIQKDITVSDAWEQLNLE